MCGTASTMRRARPPAALASPAPRWPPRNRATTEPCPGHGHDVSGARPVGGRQVPDRARHGVRDPRHGDAPLDGREAAARAPARVAQGEPSRRGGRGAAAARLGRRPRLAHDDGHLRARAAVRRLARGRGATLAAEACVAPGLAQGGVAPPHAEKGQAGREGRGARAGGGAAHGGVGGARRARARPRHGDRPAADAAQGAARRRACRRRRQPARRPRDRRRRQPARRWLWRPRGGPARRDQHAARAAGGDSADRVAAHAAARRVALCPPRRAAIAPPFPRRLAAARGAAAGRNRVRRGLVHQPPRQGRARRTHRPRRRLRRRARPPDRRGAAAAGDLRGAHKQQRRPRVGDWALHLAVRLVRGRDPRARDLRAAARVRHHGRALRELARALGVAARPRGRAAPARRRIARGASFTPPPCARR